MHFNLERPRHRARRIVSLVFLSCIATALIGRATETVWLDELDLAKTQQGWGQPGKNVSVDGHKLTIGDREFERGLGTHAESTLAIDLQGGADHFGAFVGVDSEVKGSVGSVEFKIFGDGKMLWRSWVMHPGDAAKEVDVPLTGVKQLTLNVTAGGDGVQFDHADWADAKFAISGAKPVVVEAPHEEAIVLTPPAPPTPRINGAPVVGVRPGHPLLFTIAATGDRPMTFAAEGLPAGLTLNPATGGITGSVAERGEYPVTLHAHNALGEATRKLRIVVGDRIALTPPMGWNSWNCFASAVSDEKVRAAAKTMVDRGLVNHGWQYINIDDYWQVNRSSKDPTLQGPQRDAAGRILPNPRFPDMKGLADYIHSLGLKAGLYSSPGPWTCGGCVGSYQHEELDAQQYADWGFDYLKYDWCDYEGIAKNKSLYELMKPYFIMGDALRRQNRDIVFSLCQYGMGNVSAWGDKVGGNSWRTTSDITDNWLSMSGIGFNQFGLEYFAQPGNWNDPDMLVVGKVGWGPALHATKLTPNEQYTHISLWCLLSAPLLIGCDMTQMDDFTYGLLSNDEVLAVDQDPLGQQARRVSKDGDLEVWAKPLADGSLAVGLFNRGETPEKVTAKWSDLGVTGGQTVRDLWRQKDLGQFEGQFQTDVARHGVVLVRLTSATNRAMK